MERFAPEVMPLTERDVPGAAAPVPELVATACAHQNGYA